jgi:UPF0755 protein
LTPGPPPVPGGRSDDERERARLAREARRGGGRPSSTRTRAVDPRVQQALERRRLRTESNGGQPRVPREPRHAPNFRLRRLFLLVLLVFVLVAGWFLVSLYQPFAGDAGARKTVTLKPGGVGDIAATLEDEGIISSSFFFQLRASIEGKRSDLKPGTYTLREDMKYSDVLTALEKGPPANTIQVSVPEGRSRAEIAESVTALKGDYERATKRSPDLNPRRYGAKGAKNLEGFLWPSTYEMKRGQNVKLLVRKQLGAFKQNFAKVSMSKAKSKNLTPYEVLTIASLVERETAVPRERKLIASVIYNRLAQDQSLGIDATVRFIFNKWDGALTQSELNSDNPYNTRKFKGLPPGPIGNPGLVSIRAAANPPNTDYLFYVADPCDPKGLHHTFHKTLAEFNAAVARYNAARDAAGGKAPKGC